MIVGIKKSIILTHTMYLLAIATNISVLLMTVFFLVQGKAGTLSMNFFNTKNTLSHFTLVMFNYLH